MTHLACIALAWLRCVCCAGWAAPEMWRDDFVGLKPLLAAGLRKVLFDGPICDSQKDSPAIVTVLIVSVEATQGGGR